jgi:predicted DNA-binding protein
MIKQKGFKRVDYHLTIPQWEKLKDLSEKTGIAVAGHIRMAVDKYLKSKK